MGKKRYVILPIISLLIISAVVLYHAVGWFQGDTLEYIKEHYAPDGKEIISGEYLTTGEDEQGEFIIYQVTTEDGIPHYIRVHVVFHRYLTRVGPDFRIKGISEIDRYDAPNYR